MTQPNSSQQSAQIHSVAESSTEGLLRQAHLCVEVIKNIQLGLTIWRLQDANDPTSFVLVASNPAASRITGIGLSTQVGQRILDCFPNLLNYHSNYLHHYAAIACTGRSTSLPIEMSYSDDQMTGVYRVKAFPLPDRQLGLLFEDITDRKAAEQSLQESEQRYATLAQTIPVGVFRTDRHGNRLYVNDRWQEITGIPTDEPSESEWTAALHPQDRDRVVTAWNDCVQRQIFFEEEYRFQRPDNTVGWVLGRAIPQTDDEDNVVGVVGSITDISDRKQAEIALRESEERFRATFEQAAVGIAHIAEDGQWLRVNQTLCDTLGYLREQLMALSYHDITPVEYRDRDRTLLQQLVTGDTDTDVLQKEVVRADGSRIWVEITASAVREEWGDVQPALQLMSTITANEQSTNVPRVKYLLAVIEDISERKQAELDLYERANELSSLNAVLSQTTALLQRRNEELDQFAYVASHDLKAPLRAIANLSEWIEEDLEGKLPDENQRQMQLLRGRVHRMEALIDALLEYSRVGRIPTEQESVDLHDLLAEIVDLLDPPSSVTIALPPPMPALVTRRLLLRQVFANLISNAINHHNRSDGTITVSVRELDDAYEFAIADDGPGIDPKYHQKVFTIFQTLESRDSKESTGIGLAIVKKIIDTEGGNIWIESALGEGSTFYFTWPKAPAKWL
jgi:PAS domain S-box-containing protein